MKNFTWISYQNSTREWKISRHFAPLRSTLISIKKVSEKNFTSIRYCESFITLFFLRAKQRATNNLFTFFPKGAFKTFSINEFSFFPLFLPLYGIFQFISAQNQQKRPKSSSDEREMYTHSLSVSWHSILCVYDAFFFIFFLSLSTRSAGQIDSKENYVDTIFYIIFHTQWICVWGDDGGK
jgi:hypothetical protein